MEQANIENLVAQRSALIYLPIALSVATLFFVVASLSGEYQPVAKIGGMVWVGLLSLIVSMPLVTARMKKHLRSR